MEKMTKQKLKFKIDGGLSKLSELYAATDSAGADAYFDNPAALMSALSVEPAREIRLAQGYKKLSDALCSFDFAGFHDVIEEEGKAPCGLNLNVLQTMWDKVGGLDCTVHLDEKQLSGPIVAVAVSMITVAVAFVNLSGRNDDTAEKVPAVPVRRKPPAGPKFASREELHIMAQHAQIVADHIWLS